MLGDVEKALEAERARLADQQARDEVQKRYRRFLDHRKEALFRDTQFTGVMLPTNLDLTRKAAEAALGVFADRRHDDTGNSATFPRRCRANSRPRFEEGCYELLLVLAEAVAAQDPAQVDRALADPRERRPAQARAFTGVST